MQENNDTPPPPSRPSSLACVPCRRRHLKCDALMPACSRCQTTNTECRYVRSRRGLRSRHTRSASASAQLLEDEISLFDPDVFSDWLSTADSGLLGDLDVHTAQAFFQPLDTMQVFDPQQAVTDPSTLLLPQPHLQGNIPLMTIPDMAYDPMVQLYYQNFHRSHPILLPRKALHGPIAHLIPPYIFSIMRYIGAHFYPDQMFKQAFRQPAYSALSEPTSVKDGFKVQALLLLAIVDHSHCHEDSAHRLIQAAVNLALEIGMHRSCFARKHANGYSVLEESWRRTFWEVYVVDGLLATMREQSLFRLFRQRGVDVRLPCAEGVYNSDHVILTRKTLTDLQNCWMLDAAEQPFSSFAYRINAVRNLGVVLELNLSLDVNLDTQIETIDAHLAASLMALPSIQGEGYDSSSHDEMVFQAQMATYLAMIFLHHPRSSMRFASFHTTPQTQSQTSCTYFRAVNDYPTSPTSSGVLDLHSHKLLRAADLLSGLATLPSPIRYRSPFFTCALAMCVVVHTAAGLVFSSSNAGSGVGIGAGKQESLKTRIQLSIGALNALGKVWPLARRVRGQMVDMYQGVGS